ncbi:hypothetical protein MMC25_000748 [Agyrium rufum]|nr:hypothetical protein [Agyrium rufum]
MAAQTLSKAHPSTIPPKNPTSLPPILADYAQDPLIPSAYAYVKQYMSQPHFDASHDFTHIQRVLSLALKILASEQTTHPTKTYDKRLIVLTALTHDIGDRKYVLPSWDGIAPSDDAAVRTALMSFGASQEIADTVQTLATCVSYSHEMKNGAFVASVIAKHPELGIVQDADRLDALGAVGIARVFTFAAAKGKEASGAREWEHGVFKHVGKKLYKLGGLMKTITGKQLARERTRRLREFEGWFRDECGVVIASERESGGQYDAYS